MTEVRFKLGSAASVVEPEAPSEISAVTLAGSTGGFVEARVLATDLVVVPWAFLVLTAAVA